MKYAVIDTESNGLFDFSKPADAEGQARLASFAVCLLNEDFAAFRESEVLVKPDGWQMTPEATAVNGFTTEHLLEHGRPIKNVLAAYSDIIALGYVIVSFNAQFDTKVMRGELRRAGMPDLFEKTPNICVMRALTSVCKIPKKTGGGFKFPKLSEACAHFKLEQPAAHSALGDARSAAQLLRELHKLNLVPAPEVHFAKVQPQPIVPSP